MLFPCWLSMTRCHQKPIARSSLSYVSVSLISLSYDDGGRVSPVCGGALRATLNEPSIGSTAVCFSRSVHSEQQTFVDGAGLIGRWGQVVADGAVPPTSVARGKPIAASRLADEEDQECALCRTRNVANP